MTNEIFLFGSLSATAFSMITAILLFTVFAVAGGILVRRAGWKTLPALIVFLILAILRGIVPLEIIRAKIVHYPESISKIFYTLYTPRILSLSVLDMIGLLWLLGAVSSLLVFLWKMIRQHKEVMRITGNASESLKELFLHVCTETKIRKKGVLFVGENISTPMMVGFFKPIVLLPKWYEGHAEEELRLIFRHELAHFRNLDLWKKTALCILCCIFWWNPAAYFLRRAVTQTQELRADSFACAGADEGTRLRYAKAMLDVLKSRKGKEKLAAAGYFNRSSDQYLKQRFKEILQFNRPKSKTVLAWVAVALALVVFLSSYMVNFQSAFAPNNAEEYVAEGPAPNRFILNLGNGMYQLYSDGQWIATLSEEDLASNEYNSLPIYDAAANGEEGDTK